jgi:outer membrane protein OmpA-like peptidoglycan-associated protein
MQVTAAEAEKLSNTAKECVITKTNSVSASVSTAAGALPQELADYTVSVYFNYNDNSITPQEAKKLRETAEFLKKNQEGAKFWVMLTAQSDATGTPAANMELSRRRGLVTRYFLMDQGVAAERILIKPLGAVQPAVDKETKKKRKANPESRKVVITLEPFKLLEGYRVGDPFLRDAHAMGNTNQ